MTPAPGGRPGAVRHDRLAPTFVAAFPWGRWEALVRRSPVVLDRPRLSRHPAFPDIVYPIDYGYVAGTSSGDGEAVDVFVGAAPALGLVGAALTRDHRRGDREVKLLWGTTPAEVYLVHGFLNFAPDHLDGTLALRWPMAELWARAGTTGT